MQYSKSFEEQVAGRTRIFSKRKPFREFNFVDLSTLRTRRTVE
ncbi:MAG: hypothetical protein WC548_03860 [Candidatus Pacearchaeota archaeon]